MSKPTLIVQIRRASPDGKPLEGVGAPTTIYRGLGETWAEIARQSALQAAVLAGAKVFLDGCAYLPNGEPVRQLVITTKYEWPPKRRAP